MLKKENKTSDIKEYRRQYQLKNKEKIKAYNKKRYKRKTKILDEKAFQKKCLEKIFNYSQYWLISYTELRRNKEKLKFKTFQTMTSMRNVDAECMPHIWSNIDDERDSF